MAETKNTRTKKKQLGQFLTPTKLSKKLCDKIKFSKNDKVLEPSFGDGSFLLVLIESLFALKKKKNTMKSLKLEYLNTMKN